MQNSKLIIKQNVPLAPYTSFKIGGHAKYFCEAENEDDLRAALEKARELNARFFILGGGSNILISDSGFNGMTIRMKSAIRQPAESDDIKISDNVVRASAGVLLGRLVEQSWKAGLSGLEWAAGIPGTLGGAIRGNAGIPEGTIGNIVRKVRVLSPDGEIKELSQSECLFGYRDSVFKRGDDIILSAELGLISDNKDEIKKRMDERLNFRRNKHPLEYPSAGCVFKNVWAPQLKPRFQEKFRDFIKNDKISAPLGGAGALSVSAGFLISEAGLKGKKIGGAMVSEKHANFLVNADGATAEEMIILISLIKQKVRNNFGALLEEEIQYVGF